MGKTEQGYLSTGCKEGSCLFCEYKVYSVRLTTAVTANTTVFELNLHGCLVPPGVRAALVPPSAAMCRSAERAGAARARSRRRSRSA